MNPAARFPEIAAKIIKEQEFVIGPLAWEEARKVAGIQVVDEKKGEVTIQDADPKGIIDRLVAQYEKIFGKASHAVCHDAVKDILAQMPPEEVPASLR